MPRPKRKPKAGLSQAEDIPAEPHTDTISGDAGTPILRELSNKEENIIFTNTMWPQLHAPARPKTLNDIIQNLQTGRASLAALRAKVGDHLSAYRPISLLSGHAFRVYTMCFSPNTRYIAAGGEDGRVCVFPATNVDIGQEPLTVEEINRPRSARGISNVMSIQLHSKWISGLAYATTDRLLSTSDTGDLSLSLLSLNDHGRFDCTAISSVALSNMGLYSMHYYESSNEVITSSKDSAIRIVKLTPCGLKETDCFENIHEGVTKSVRWRDHSVFASVGNDRCVVVTDRRDRKNKTTVIISPHKTVVNSVGWRPFYEHQLFSSGFDPQIYIYDIRFAASPLHTLDNHTPAEIKRLSSIYRPIFYLGGRFLVTATDKTNALFFYNTTTGTLEHKCKTGAVYATLDTPSVDSSLIAGSAATKLHVWQPALGAINATQCSPSAIPPQKKLKTSKYF